MIVSKCQPDKVWAVLNNWDVIICLPTGYGKPLNMFFLYPGATILPRRGHAFIAVIILSPLLPVVQILGQVFCYAEQ